MRHFFLSLSFAALALLLAGPVAALFGLAFGALVAEVLALRRRLARLESRLATAAGEGKTAKRADKEEGVVFTPVEEDPRDQKPPCDRQGFAGLRPPATGMAAFLAALGGGNPLQRLGMLLLLLGLGFLLNYTAQMDLLPLELRLAGVALVGLFLLLLGWRLRRRPTGYGLVLQGGGCGVLYLVVFAAARLYQFLPPLFALSLLVLLVGLSTVLSVAQHARGLALAAAVGGFLAPVLLGSGGAHVPLFTYYALLNLGIVGIAWRQSWRELNLCGFLFTFAIGSLWGYQGYRPEHFATTEPFLIFSFLLYLAVPVLFARRQPPQLHGTVDGSLVFGLPLLAAGLQYRLVGDLPYGMAASCLVLAGLYFGLFYLLRSRRPDRYALLAEAFFALGVVFASLAIPLALESQWSSALWALEGAGLVWLGVRQGRVAARHGGIALQLAAAWVFADGVWYPLTATAFANPYFLGTLLIALAALASSFWLDRYQAILFSWERHFPLPLLLFGLAWLAVGGSREVARQLPAAELVNGLLLLSSLASLLFARLEGWLVWPRFLPTLSLHLIAMLLLAAWSPRLTGQAGLFAGWGAAAWALAFLVQYRLLARYAGNWPGNLEAAGHLGSCWLLVALLSQEAARRLGQHPILGEDWPLVALGLLPLVAVLAINLLARGESWPVGRQRQWYGGTGLLPLLAWLVFWLLATFFRAGDLAPLAYLPLLNPLELSELLVLAGLYYWLQRGYKPVALGSRVAENLLHWGLAGLLFLFLNVSVARVCHLFAEIPFRLGPLFNSTLFQAAIASLWGVTALVLAVRAARTANRGMWLAGAGLLGLTVVKLFAVDLAASGTLARIVSFLVVGVLLLLVGYTSPLPPRGDTGRG
jgi:uncharacterized membrane protein